MTFGRFAGGYFYYIFTDIFLSFYIANIRVNEYNVLWYVVDLMEG